MNQKLKKIIVKKLIKYPRLFDYAKRFRKVVNPKVFSAVVSYEQAATYTKELTKKIPNDFDVVIGIPRSGIFIASIIATKFGRPLTTPDLFIEKKIWESSLVKSPKKIKRVLLVDDSVGSGETFDKVTEKLIEYNPNLIIKRASLFAHNKNKVDYVFDVKKPQCIFEWQIIQNSRYKKLSVDMDGVLCEDCPIGIGLIEEEYIKWMKKAKPFIIPINEIESIITSRLEKYRDITEKWLKENNVKYQNLFMMDIENGYSKTSDAVVSFKSYSLKESGSEWFWESNFCEAFEINKQTNIPVLCTDEMVLLDKNGKR